MKNILSIFAFSILGLCQAQVIIGGSNGTAPTNKKSAVLLEFEAGQNKGIILPYVVNLPSVSDTTPGTLLLDVSNNNATEAFVKVYAPGNQKADGRGWIDLSSGNRANLTSPTNYMAAQTNEPELENSKAIIGSNNTSAKGVLVLESNTKAMVLPHVSSTDNIINPAPGMMVYVTGTYKRLAVFNGAKWTYWEAE